MLPALILHQATPRDGHDADTHEQPHDRGAQLKGAEQQRARQQEQELSAKRADGDLPDDPRLAIGRDVCDVVQKGCKSRGHIRMSKRR
jgi:hypothetical protein